MDGFSGEHGCDFRNYIKSPLTFQCPYFRKAFLLGIGSSAFSTLTKQHLPL